MERLQAEVEKAAPDDEAVSPLRDAVGFAFAVMVSLGLIAAFLSGAYLALDGMGRYAFQGQDSLALLTRMLLVMSIALGVPLAVIAAWGVRHLMRVGRPHRRGVLVAACVCFVLGLPSVWLVTSAVNRVELDAAVAFETSLDVAEVEADGVAHLEWMARSLTLNLVAPPEVSRASCVLTDGSRGVAPTVVMRAETGRVASNDLTRVAQSFWEAEGYAPHEGAGRFAYISGTPLEDPYLDVLVIPDGLGPDVHELSYHGVCMKLPSPPAD